MRYSMRIYLKNPKEVLKLQKTGLLFITKKDRTAPLAEFRLETIKHIQKATL
jgi:hypothetical protein